MIINTNTTKSKCNREDNTLIHQDLDIGITMEPNYRSLGQKGKKMPQVSDVVSFASLPRTASNKVMRRVLRQQLTKTGQKGKL
ncbi:hypothetical protein LXL04_031501 [Taraxacum kok-saghyz]